MNFDYRRIKRPRLYNVKKRKIALIGLASLLALNLLMPTIIQNPDEGNETVIMHIILWHTTFSCSNGTTKGDYFEADTLCSTPQCVVVLQPYEDFSRKEVEKLLPKLQKAFDKWLYGHWEFKIANPISLPKNSYVKERNRYRVTPILNYESKQLTGYEVIIGLTHKDICTDIHTRKIME